MGMVKQLAGEFFGRDNAGLGSAGVGLHLAIGGDHCPVAGGAPEGFQPIANGTVGSASQPHEVGGNQSHPFCPYLSRWRAVEIHFHRAASQAAKFLQEGNQFVFVFGVIQSQTKFGDEIVAINQIRHGLILPPTKILVTVCERRTGLS